MAILMAGLMPNDVKELYDNAKKKRGSGEMRSEETKIMNRFLQRNKDGKFEKNPEDPYFKKRREHKQTAYNDEFHLGVGWDEACMKVGGEDKLTAAVRGKRAKASANGEDWGNYLLPFSSHQSGRH